MGKEQKHWYRYGVWLGMIVSGICTAQVRTSPAPVEEKETPPEIRPASQFDKAAAIAALGKGGSTIEGVACTYHDNGTPTRKNLVFRPAGQKVMLFPATPYFNEVFSLVGKGGRHGQTVTMSKEAFNTRIDAETDDYGRFRFSDMRPGMYHLYMHWSFNQNATRNVYIGSSATDYGDVDHYEKEGYQIPRSDELFRDVEIKADGAIVNVTMVGGDPSGPFARLLSCK